MIRLFSWFQNVLLRQAIAVFLITLAFFGIPAFGYDRAMLAQADTVKTPEGIYYKGTPDGNGNINKDNRFVEKARKNLQDTTENTKNRFNTDKPLSRSISNTVRTPEGTYYKGTPDNDNNIVDKAKQGLQGTAENIKGKLKP